MAIDIDAGIRSGLGGTILVGRLLRAHSSPTASRINACHTRLTEQD
jgi:hypothetical protein